ncbi:tyrosine-type recombinase/integrase [Polaribacter litorisediminis]|uniref:tyrosine-type recombinase/integrase n=1 Tax=Polaribacter litorisediminis TaxID=1908341 RepID=UPI001CBB7300|nr:tyrosine-type recombinase/integrase [Polaribacter litorisediminis]
MTEFKDVLSTKRYAKMRDRLLVEEGKEQLFGTQWNFKNSKRVPHPIQKPEYVDTPAGLRISEVLNLRITDIHSKKTYLFIKDRKTILSAYLVELLRTYYKNEKPSYWLFEGKTGGKYSTTNVQAIFRKAVKETHTNSWATVNRLRHSFATHCIEDHINLRYVQNMLGHSSPKITEIYTKTIHINKT